MKVAIAGTGNVALYLMEELSAYGHEIVVLTRRKKSNVPYEQRETDYSIPSLVSVLEDREALISTVSDYSNLALGIKVHLDMLEAVKQSKRCKTFIPSEWTLNVEDHPEQPMFHAESNDTVHDALKKSTGIRWTIIANSWLADYVVPAQNRYLRSPGTFFPMDHDNKVFTIYGDGTSLLDMTSVRDVARSVAILLDSKEPWEPYTTLSGTQLTWNELFAVVKKRNPAWTSRTKQLAEIVNQIADNKSPESVMEAQFEIQGFAGALQFPVERTQRHRTKYFPNLHFRTVQELLDEVQNNPSVIV